MKRFSKSPDPHRPSRFLALILSLLPDDLVRRHGAEILDAACRLRAEPQYQRAVVGPVRYWVDVLADLGRAGVRAWAFHLQFSLSPTPSAVPAGSPRSHGAGAIRGRRLRRPRETANDRWKRGSGTRLWSSLIVATAVHFLVLAYFPELAADDWSPQYDVTPVVIPPPMAPLPPPPDAISSPARPVIAETDIHPDVTIAPQEQLWNTVDALPEPPTAADDPDDGGAVWLGPSMIPPRLLNRAEVDRALEHEYPHLLRDSGIGGQVVLHVRLSADGIVHEFRVHQGSGHATLDRAAGAVVQVMRFAPAINRDHPVAVWVAIPVTFRTRDRVDARRLLDPRR